MRSRTSRRAFLVAATGVAGLHPTGVTASNDGTFNPLRHGFGFRNWSTRTQNFDVPDEDPSREAVRAKLTTDWRSSSRSILDLDFRSIPDVLVDSITSQLHGTLRQRAATNGHCYGMVLATQQYFEQPETIPLDTESASSILYPTEPLDEPDAPVYRHIVALQTEQFLRFRAWLGRRAMLWPDRIDVAAQLADVRSVIDTFGTAAVTVLTSGQSGHQVLAYDYSVHDDGTTLYVYDPNLQAARYESHRRRLEFREVNDTIRMEPYGKYEHLLYNRWDRIEAATGREQASPLDHLNLGVDAVRDSLFPMALVTVDAADVELSVRRPDGRLVGRLQSEFMDPTRGRYSRMRFGYGVDEGEYRIALLGRAETVYALRIRVTDRDGVRLDSIHEATIGAGETQNFVARVPNSAGETGALEPTEEPCDRTRATGMTGGVAGGLALGAGAYYLWNQRRD